MARNQFLERTSRPAQRLGPARRQGHEPGSLRAGSSTGNLPFTARPRGLDRVRALEPVQRADVAVDDQLATRGPRLGDRAAERFGRRRQEHEALVELEDRRHVIIVINAVEFRLEVLRDVHLHDVDV